MNADALARGHRLQGDAVGFITTTDEHGAKIGEAAEANEATPKEWTGRTSTRFKEAWQRLDISYDDFTAPPSALRLRRPGVPPADL